MADAGLVEIGGSADHLGRNYSELEEPTLYAAEVSVGENVQLDEFDEEAPLADTQAYPEGLLKDENDSIKSPPAEATFGDYSSITPPPLSPYEGDEGVSAKPLIILPVQSEGMPSSGGFPLGHSDVTSPAILPQGEELKQVLLLQLEYYFSKDNLSSDKYLLSQMDGDNYVPISVISNFNQVKKLTSDMSLILEALRDSMVLQLDETEEKVRAIPEKRCVLILREIPKDTPKEELVALFSHKPCPSCVTCEFADNNCWYVTFDSEESTQKAFAYLREEVRVFLGQPIRARIKGTTVQRSSGMPKAKHGPFNVQPVFNGTPPQHPYYPPAPPSGVMPWSPTPPTSSASPYFDSFSPYAAGNGFTPPQQGGAPSQAGTTGQSPATAAAAAAVPGSTGGGGGGGGGGQASIVQTFNGARYPPSTGRFPYMPIRGGGGGEGERGGRGRMGPSGSNRSHRVGERGQSPPGSFPAGDGEPGVASDRDKLDYKTGSDYKSARDGGPGGVAGGGKYKHIADDRKMPRLKNARYVGRVAGGEGDRGGADKAPIPPRQQNKVQPKLDLATAHFPPLPNSSSSEVGVSAPPTTCPAHTDDVMTLSDIVRGGGRTQTSAGGPVPSLAPNPSPAVVVSNMVEKTIASASAKVSQTPAVLKSPPASQPAPLESPQPSVTSDPAPQGLSHEAKGSAAGFDTTAGGPTVTTVVTATRLVTASSVVSSGGSFSAVSSGGGNRPPPTPPAPPPARGQKVDPKMTGKDKVYSNGNKAHSRYSDRELPPSKQNRTPQVPKADSRSAAASNRPRHKERGGDLPSSSRSSGGGGGGGASSSLRPNNGSRVNNTKSPKTFKKGFPAQAPPPPPGPAPDPTPDTTPPEGSQETNTKETNENISSSSSQSQSARSAKPEKLSYAQMAQKKNNQNSKFSGQDSVAEGGMAKALSTPTSPQMGMDSDPQTQSTKSTSTGSLAAGQGQSSGTVVSKSAPTSPIKESSTKELSGRGQSEV